ncbi:MAG TPA: CsbD family protein [Desulfosporosinus sp.]|nr:CsbD family protein [Desulfosporosinus sp.]
MTHVENKFENVKNKVVGKTKEAVGKTTGNEETELRGKLQSKKADLKDKFNETKEKIAGKINDKLDEKDQDKR